MTNSKIIYSTDSSVSIDSQDVTKRDKKASMMKVRLHLDRQGGNRIVTIIKGLEHNGDILKELTKELKKKCGSGGSFKDQVILIQGDKREIIQKTLSQKGYNVKFSGG